MKRKTFATLLLAAACLAGTAALAADLPPAFFENLKTVRAPVLGPADAPVTVYEIGDYMWPFCKEVGPTFQKLNSEYKGRIRFVFIPYIRSYSNDSQNAALAAFAAWDQGKIWEVHDRFFEAAPDLTREVLSAIARKAELDVGKFDKAVDGKERLPEILKVKEMLNSFDIYSTPTVVIGDKVLKGSRPYEDYKAAIEEALKAAGRASIPGPSLRRGVEMLADFLLPSARASEASKESSSSEFGPGCAPLFIKVGAARPLNALKAGDEAPAFSLPSTRGGKAALADFRGNKNVLLVFLPAAFTPVWSGQLPAYEDLLPRFAELNTQVLGVMTDNLPSLKTWTRGLGISIPVLSDFWPHGQTALSYGVLRKEGIAERAIFIVDKAGTIRYIDIHDINEDPGVNAILRTLEELEKK